MLKADSEKISTVKFKILKHFNNLSKNNPAYGRQSISQPMRIVAPIPKDRANNANIANIMLIMLIIMLKIQN